MKLSEKFSFKISNYIKKTLPDKTEEELEIIRYGLEVLFMNFAKLPIILVLGYCFGVLNYSIYTLIFFGIIRCFAGGIHARKSYTCLFSTLTVVFGAVYLSLVFHMSKFVKLLIFLFIIIIYLKYAPADTEEKPYLNAAVRKKLKIKSIITVIIYFVISVSVNKLFFSDIFIYVLLMEGILISPITYKILKRRYNNYEYYKESF